ncbi:MAG TPA: ABC transporter permease [Gaiellaceae bacterium]|nr:ABC transporter permease [Gaiellaceae bacterium]
MRLERRLEHPRWLLVAVPLGSIAFAFLLMAVVLLATGHNPGATYRRMFDAAFFANGALTSTLVFATPIVFTGLAAAAAFRMQLYNIGGEGQFYWGAIAAVGIALYLGDQGVGSTPVYVLAMSVAGALAGAAWAAIPAVLRAFARTNEIITSLMLNYIAGLVLTYLIIDSHSYWRDTESFEGQTFPLGKAIPDEAKWPSGTLDAFGGIVVPLGFGIAAAVAAVIWAVYSRTRFGYELQVIGDSQRTARFAGMRLRRKILAVMCISGAVAGLGGASFEGDFAYQIDPTGLQASFYGYTGIVVAALARYSPLAVVPVGFFIGGLLNAGFTLQGADFPAGLVGVMQGLILFCALGGEVLVRYRFRLGRGVRRAPDTPSVEAAS